MVDHLNALSQISQIGDLSVIREALERKSLRSLTHVETRKMLADCLTKDMDAEQLREVLATGCLSLFERAAVGLLLRGIELGSEI